MEQAAKAGGMTNDEDKKMQLNLAYTYEAFSAHYLSDLFSAGHLRAPRRQLHGDSYKVATESVLPCITGKDEIPVWDHHSRYVSWLELDLRKDSNEVSRCMMMTARLGFWLPTKRVTSGLHMVSST